MIDHAPIKTTDLGCAGFLALKHPLLSVTRATSGLSVFTFPAIAAADQTAYYGGALVVAQEMEASIRNMKKQLHNARPNSTINEVHRNVRPDAQ